MWEDIKDFIRYDLIEVVKGLLAFAFVVVIIVLLAEAAFSMHFNREFAREHGYYPTKTTIMDERSDECTTGSGSTAE